MTTIPAHATATVAFTRIDDLLRESQTRALANKATGRKVTARGHRRACTPSASSARPGGPRSRPHGYARSRSPDRPNGGPAPGP